MNSTENQWRNKNDSFGEGQYYALGYNLHHIVCFVDEDNFQEIFFNYFSKKYNVEKIIMKEALDLFHAENPELNE